MISPAAALQVGVALPSAEVAGRVALSVAANMAQKAQERLQEAQEDGQHSVSVAVGLADAPEEHSDEETEDEHSKALTTLWDLPVAQLKPLKGSNRNRLPQAITVYCSSNVPYSALPTNRGLCGKKHPCVGAA